MVSGAATKDVVNGKTVYTIPYVVTEAASSNPGMGRNTQVFTFTVKVTDNADGTLSTSVSKSEAIAFVNNYITNTSTVSIDGLKKIEGGRPMKAGEFQFEISGNGPLPSNTIVSNDEGGAVRFGNIEFTKADLGDATEKTFSYTVHELGSKPGVTNDSDKHFTITVTDDGQGHLKAVLNGDNPLFTFTNTYKPTPGSSSVTSQVEVVKNLVGRELKAGEFQFVMKYLNGTTVATGTNDANGKVTLGEVSFADPGEFAFQIYEVPGNETNMTYDSSVINVAAKVTDNYDGKPLQVTWIYGGEAPLTFTNNYTEATGQLVVTKQVAGTGADSAKEFTFTVTLSQALNGTYGDMVFKNGVAVITLKAGDTVTASGLPIGVTYTVEENDYSADGYTTNAEGATGTIKADVISVASFVNTKNESQTEESSSSTEESSSSTDESTGSTEESSSSTGESTGSTEESTAAQSSTAQTRGNNKDNDKTVKTGDNTNMVVWLTLMAVAVVGVVTLLLFRRRKNNYK